MAHFKPRSHYGSVSTSGLVERKAPASNMLEDRGSQAYQVFLGPSQVPESPQKRVCEDRYSLEPMMRGCEHRGHQRNYRQVHTMVSCQARVLQIKLKVPLCSVNNVASRDVEPWVIPAWVCLSKVALPPQNLQARALFRPAGGQIRSGAIGKVFRQ